MNILISYRIAAKSFIRTLFLGVITVCCCLGTVSLPYYLIFVPYSYRSATLINTPLLGHRLPVTRNPYKFYPSTLPQRNPFKSHPPTRLAKDRIFTDRKKYPDRGIFWTNRTTNIPARCTRIISLRTLRSISNKYLALPLDSIYQTLDLAIKTYRQHKYCSYRKKNITLFFLYVHIYQSLWLCKWQNRKRDNHSRASPLFTISFSWRLIDRIGQNSSMV